VFRGESFYSLCSVSRLPPFFFLLLLLPEKPLIPAVPLRNRASRVFTSILCLLLISSLHAAEINNLKKYQAVSPGPAPVSPRFFDPDPNKLNLPTNLPPATNWSRNVTINSNSPPVSPPQFNPDPGASLKRPIDQPSPLFRTDPILPPAFTPPPVAPELSLPRPDVRKGEIVPPEPPKPGTFNLEPLPKDQDLPRENAVRNLKIPQEFHAGGYSAKIYPTNTEPRTDRWRIGFVPWKRYTSGVTEQPYESPEPMLWHPYKQSLLKGDVPIIGQDIFLNLTASSQTELEFRRLPTASGVSAAAPGAYEFYGESEQIALQNNVGFGIELFKGETSFKPTEWAIKLEPVFNINYLSVRETGVVSPDPRGSISGNNNTPPPNNGFVLNPSDIDALLNGQVGPAGSFRAQQHTERLKTFLALQQAFGELHLHDLTDNYDFIALRAGLQPFNSDFRGFLFNDVNLGVRAFGNWDNNRFQYNLAGFDMREKDSNSELNTLDPRDQQVLIANFYWQDFLWKGYTPQWSVHGNFDHGGTHYDRNGNIVRPAPIGTVREHDLNVGYLGWAGDGHIGRWNVSHAFYQAFGHDSFNGLAGQPVDINAQMAALEVSYDHDWLRYKGSFFYSSGDANTENHTATGFDTIFDNPNFTGGPFSYWTRQGFNLGGTLVNLKQRGSLVPDLRTSKGEGQANFVNPGVFIFGLGVELDVTPKLRSFINANYIRLSETDPIKTALLTDKVNPEIGWDLSLGVQYRPLLTDNIIISAGFGTLLPGRGFKDIYQTNTDPVPNFDRTDRRGQVDSFLYSGLLAITLTY
jgi:hypothetical protein